MLLRAFGASIGRGVHIHPTARIAIPWNISVGDYSAVGARVDLYSLGPIQIGAYVTISQNAHLCAGTHDYATISLPLIKASIEVGDSAWICADAFIGPSVKVGEFSIVGARAVATKDVPPWAIVAGNPVRVIGIRPPLGTP